MTIMTKRGQQDNVITYEHICDTANDLKNIKPEYITLGSTAVVLQDESGFQVYMANSQKEWTPLVVSGGASEQSSSLSIHICSNEEIDENGLPAIEAPQENELYLTPAADSSAGNLYDEYIYVNNAYEKFGSSTAAITQAQSDWNQNDSTATDYIKNRICYEEGEALYETTIDLTQYTPTEGGGYNILLDGNLQLTQNQIIPKIKFGNEYYDNSLVFAYGYALFIVFGINDRSIAIEKIEQNIYSGIMSRINPSTYQRETILVIRSEIEDPTQPITLILYNAFNVKQIDDKYLIQPDWYEEDTSKASYIKNKICEENKVTLSYNVNSYSGTSSGGYYTLDFTILPFALYEGMRVPYISFLNQEYQNTVIYTRFVDDELYIAPGADGPNKSTAFWYLTAKKGENSHLTFHASDGYVPQDTNNYELKITFGTISQIDPKWIPKRVHSNFTVEGGYLTLGSTTISEAQLQSLLALINTNSGS